MYGTVFDRLRYDGNINRSRIRHFGVRHYCPVCKSFSAKFGDFGVPKREHARCEVCGALERHRFVWHFLQSKLEIFAGEPTKVLHFAPVPVLRERLSKAASVDYFAVDLVDPNADVRLDITRLPFTANSIDLVLCLHVLEHIPNDLGAMSEIHRVTAGTGCAIFMVPLNRSLTLEAIEATSIERQQLFNNPYHVRDYGWDIVNKLERVGFKVTTYYPRTLLNRVQCKFFSPNSQDVIFYCVK